MTNAERFLNHQSQKSSASSAPGEDAKARFLKHSQEVESRLAPQRVSSWISDSDSFINTITSQYKGTTDEKFYNLSDDDIQKASSLIVSAPKMLTYLNNINASDENKKKYAEGISNLKSTLEEIAGGTYGQQKYNYNGGQYTLSQLQEMKKTSESEKSINSGFLNFSNSLTPKKVGQTNGILPNAPTIDQTKKANYEKASVEESNVSKAIRDINSYNTYVANKEEQDHYNSLKSNKDFSVKSKYVSTKNNNKFANLFPSGDSGWTYNGNYNDLGYEYINNVDDIRNQLKWRSSANDSTSSYEQKGYDYITDGEKSIYNYLYSTKGKDEASKYIDSLDLTQRMTESYQNKWADYASKHPVIASAASVPMAAEGWKGYEENLLNYVSGNKVDENSYYNIAPNSAQTARDTVSSNMDGAGKFLYGTGMSMADFLYNGAISGGNEPLTLAIMGSNAANQIVNNAKQRGLSDGQAMLLGTIAGAAEVVTEKVSIDALLDKTTLGKNAVGYMLKNVLTEGSEEVGSDVINLVADTLISKDKAQWRQAMQQYENQGDDENTAFWKSVGDQASQMGLDFAGGGLSGGIMAGGAVGISKAAENYNSYQAGKEIKTNGETNSLVQSGMSADKNSALYQAALKVAGELQSGKNVSNYDIGKLADLYSQSNTVTAPAESTTPQKSRQAEEVTTTAVETEPQKNAVAEALISRGVDENTAAVLSKVADGTYTDADYHSLHVIDPDIQAAYKAVTGQTLGDTKSEVGKTAKAVLQSTANSAINSAAQAPESATPSEMPSDALNSAVANGTSNYTGNTTNAEPIKAEKAAQASAHIGDTDVVVNQITSSKDGNVIVSLDNGGSADVSDLTFDDPEIAKVYTAASKYETDAARAFVEGYDGSIPLDKYSLSANQYIRAGMVGNSKESVSNGEAGKLIESEVTRESLYQAGKNDAAASVAESEKSSTEVKEKGKAEQNEPKAEQNEQKAEQNVSETENKKDKGTGGVRKEYAAELNDDQKAQLDALDGAGKALGVTFVVKDSIAEGAANGLYNSKTHEMEIAVDAAVGKDGEYIKGAYMRAAGHELTHYIQELSPEKYGVLRDFIVNELSGQNEAAYENRIRAVTLANSKEGIKLSRDEAIDELVADSCEMFLKDSSAAQRLAKQDRTLGQKISDFIKDLVGKMQKVFDGITAKSPEAKYLEQNIETMKKAQSMWDEALADTEKESSDERAGIRYQLKDVSDVDYEKLADENEKLRESAELLKKQFEIVQGHHVSDNAVEKMAGSLLRRYSSKYDKDTLTHNLKSLFEYMANDPEASGNEIMSTATDIAMKVLENSKSLNTDMNEKYKNLSNDLRTTGISLSDNVKKEITYNYGSYDDFRRKNFGRIKFTNDGIPLDEKWGELCEMYPEFFSEDTSEYEQPTRLAEVLDAIKPFYENKYSAEYDGMTMEQTAADIAQNIYQQYFNLPEVTTFATKKAKEMALLKAKYANKIADLRTDYHASYEKKLQSVRKAQINKIAELTEKYNAAKGTDKAAYLDKIKQLRAAYSDKLASQKALFVEKTKEIQEKRIESDAKRKYRTRIEQDASDLYTWLQRPTDSKHVPQFMRETVGNLLKTIDFSSDRMNVYGKPTSKTISWREALINLRSEFSAAERSQNGDDSSGAQYQDFYMDIDPDLKNRIDDFYQKNKNVQNLSELDSTQAHEMSNILKAVKQAITTADKLRANEKYRDISTLGSATLEDMVRKKSKPVHSYLVQAADDMLNLHQLDSFSYFSELGDASETVLRGLRKGFDKKVGNLSSAKDYMQKLIGDTDIGSWTGRKAKLHTFKIGGEDLRLTTSQIMELYELNKREQARGHIYGGGIKPENRTVRVKEKAGAFNINKTLTFKSYSPVSVTPEDIIKITSVLTKEQIKIADGMQKFMGDECSKWGNEVSMELYGYRKYTEPNYYPIKSDENYTNTKDQDNNGNLYALKNLGMTKALVRKANNPLIIHDIFDTFTRHIDEMSSYNGLVIPMSDAMKWYNYREKSGINYVGSVKQSIDRVMGAGGKSYFTNLIKAINGVGTKSNVDTLGEIALRNTKIASVGANLRVVIQQPTAYIRAAAVIDPQYLAKAIFKKANVDLMYKYSPISLWKSWGFFEMDTGRSLKDIITGDEGPIEMVQRVSLLPAQKADDITWGKLWNAAELEIQDKQPKLKAGTEEYYKAVGDRLSEIVDKTQVVDSIFHRSELMRDKSTFSKMVSSFMSEPIKSYNLLRNAVVDVAQNNTAATRQKLARTGLVYVLTAVTTAAAASLVDALREKDKDIKDNDGNVIGSESFGQKYIENFGKESLDNVNPLNMVAYAKDIWSIVQGYTPTRMDMAGVVSLIQSGIAWNSYFKGTGRKSVYELISGSTQSLSKLTGIPAGSLLREVQGVYDTITSGGINPEDISKPAADRFAAAQAEYDITKKDTDGSYNSAVNNKYYDILYAAKQQKDTSTYNQVYNYLLQNGRKKSSIDGAIKTRDVKTLKQDSRITDAANAQIAKDYPKRMQIIKEFVAEGYKQDTVESAISDAALDINKANAPTPEEFIAAYKTGDHSKWWPLYQKLKAAGWTQEDIMTLVK